MNAPVSATKGKEILMAKRERIKLTRVEGDRNRMQDRASTLLWYDSRSVREDSFPTSVLSRIGNLGYTGVVLYPENVNALLPLLGTRLEKILHIESLEMWENASAELSIDANWIVASPQLDVLQKAQNEGLPTCYRAYVDDGESLNTSIERGSRHDYLMVSFRDPTNIPLELVIATLQATQTVLIKEITDKEGVDDALVTLGVMEVGADGVMFSPSQHELLEEFLGKLKAEKTPKTSIEVATVIRTAPVGMGYRTCLDLATLFTPTEGMLVGSTSQGGILCCPEVFFLPYMELRPFRVNAGAVHSYVYNLENRTDYMTELRAGSSVMISDTQGNIRQACIGRTKTEVRPLRLIEVEFKSGERVNVLMQDDWHVRIFSDDSRPLNITELKPGDKVLGHLAQPGRHVGIKVDEHIVEN